MDIYISCHDRALAEDAAKALRSAGHTVTSTWHTGEAVRSTPLPDAEKTAKAGANFRQIDDSEALVLISGTDRYPGGKFVEAGYALGIGLHVVVVGVRENLLLHDVNTRVAATIDDVDAELAQLNI